MLPSRVCTFILCRVPANFGDIPNPMSVRRMTFRIRTVLLTAVIALTASLAFGQQQQTLPDAPAPQNNAPLPSPKVPPSTSSDDQGSSTSSGNPGQPGNTRPDEKPNPQPPPPGSQEIKTVPPGSVPAEESGRDALFSLTKNVSFVSVPVTVKDHEGKMVEGLLAKDFTILENGAAQKLTFFTSDPFPLAAALIIDQGLPDPGAAQDQSDLRGAGRCFWPLR